jgi:hypothetical protein
MNPQLPSTANHRSLRRQEETDEPFDLERQESADGLRPFVHVPSFAQDKSPDPADKPAPAADNADELRKEAQNLVASDCFGLQYGATLRFKQEEGSYEQT